MVVITAELYKNAVVDVITDNDYCWVKKMKDVQDGLGIKNMRDRLGRTMQGIFETKNLTKEQKKQYIRSKNEINKDLKNNYYKYSRRDITEQVIKNCKVIKQCNDGANRLDKEKQRENFRQLLSFKENEVFESKEYSITKKIKKTFKKQKIIDQYRVEKYFIDLFFPVHKLGIEIDENCHLDRPQIKE